MGEEENGKKRGIGAIGMNVHTGKLMVFRAKATLLTMSRPARVWLFNPDLTGLCEFRPMQSIGSGHAMGWRAGMEFTMMEKTVRAEFSAAGRSFPPYGAGNNHNTWYAATMVDARGVEIPYVTKFYDNAFVAYSFSKTLSIPGERIGYLIVSPEMKQWREMANAVTVANRICGYINAPSLLQKAVARCLDEKCDIAFYDNNRKLLWGGLTELGFECVKPEGTFYLFVNSPEPDEHNFVARAKAHNLILVVGSTFAMPGYVRIAYCVSPDMIRRSMPHFEALAKEYALR